MLSWLGLDRYERRDGHGPSALLMAPCKQLERSRSRSAVGHGERRVLPEYGAGISRELGPFLLFMERAKLLP